jgi:hypothetical protein
MNEPLLDLIGFVGAVAALLVDRRRAVLLASFAVALCLAPSAANFGGGAAALVLLGAALAAAVLGTAARRLGRRLSRGQGLDPLVPLFSPRQELFGPRSLRLFAGALAIPAASWISYNVPVGTVDVVRGLLFPIAYVFLSGVIRLLLARTTEDLAVGVAVVGLATSAAWFLRGGSDPLPGAIAAAALAPLAAILADLLAGRAVARLTSAAAGIAS